MRIYELDSVDSTNEYAKKLIKEVSRSIPFIVRANQQTSGKGQGSNRWESRAKENLLCSIVIKPQHILAEEQFLISQVVSVALLDVLSEFNLNAFIKWPNDIYVNHKKVAGILIENTILGANIEHCIIGIGLNINQTEFSEKIPNPSSLKKETGKHFEIHQVLERIVSRINFHFNHRNEISKKYEENLYLRNIESLFYDACKNPFKGCITGVNEIGQLLIENSNTQEILKFSNQEVQFSIT